MYIWNTGTITFNEKVDEEVERIVEDELMCHVDCFDTKIEINEVGGDIWSELEHIVKKCSNLNPVSNMYIEFYGDYEGRYVLKDGAVDCEERRFLDEYTVEELKKEIESRGGVSCVCTVDKHLNNVV